jgi:hypothetical protein
VFISSQVQVPVSWHGHDPVEAQSGRQVPTSKQDGSQASRDSDNCWGGG